MKIIKSIHYLLIAYFLSTNIVLGQLKNTIVAKVGTQIITSIDVENEIKTILILTNTEFSQKNINKAKKNAIQSLIKKSIKKSEVEKYKIKNFSNKDLDNYLVNIAKQFSTSKSGLRTLFIEKNIDYDLFIENYKTDLLWNTLIFELYSSKINLNPIEIENIIKREISKNNTIKEFNLSEIEIPLDKDEEYISNIYDTIKNESFSNAAKKYSISASSSNEGSIGWISEKSINKNFFNTINNMNINDISKPIRYLNSKVIFKLNNIKINKADEVDIKKLKENIVLQMKNEKLNLFSRSHFTNIKNRTLVDFQ